MAVSDDQTISENGIPGGSRSEQLIRAGLVLSSELSIDSVLQRKAPYNSFILVLGIIFLAASVGNLIKK